MVTGQQLTADLAKNMQNIANYLKNAITPATQKLL